MFVSVLLYITLCPFQFWNYLEEENKDVFFTIIVLLMYCCYKCYLALLGSTRGWYAVCDCGIS